MRLQLFKSKGNSIFCFVEIQNDNIDLFIERHNLGWMRHAAPRQIIDVKQSVDAAKVDKNAEISYIFNNAFKNLASFQISEYLFTLTLHRLFNKNAMRDDDILAQVVYFYNLEIQGLTDKRVEITNRPNINLRARQKCIHSAEIDNNAALDTTDALTLQDITSFIGFNNLVPGAHKIGFSLREN